MGAVAGGAKPPTGSGLSFPLSVTFSPNASDPEAIYQGLKELMRFNQVPENIINQMSLNDIRPYFGDFSSRRTLTVVYKNDRFYYFCK